MKNKEDLKLTWDNAYDWLQKANEDKDEDYNGDGIFSIVPYWGWDCNFRLDFDGSIIILSSRFYPPHKNDHDDWEGDCEIRDTKTDEVIKREYFREKTVDELKEKVEAWFDEIHHKITNVIKAFIQNNMNQKNKGEII